MRDLKVENRSLKAKLKTLEAEVGKLSAENAAQKATIEMMEARCKACEGDCVAAHAMVVRLRPLAFLPNEILVHIFARVRPHDIVSIVSTCKRFRSAGVLFIKRMLARSLTQHQLNETLCKLVDGANEVGVRHLY